MNKRDKMSKYDKDEIIIYDSFMNKENEKCYEISHCGKFEIITQEELNLLKTYPLDEYSSEELKLIFEVVSRTHKNRNFNLGGYSFSNADDFSRYFDNLQPINNDNYGNIIFDSLDMEPFFKNPLKNENILQDIKLLNERNNYPSKIIPGTKIEIINFSKCPKCGQLYSLKDLNDYFSNPEINPDIEKSIIYRTDTRFKCEQCKSFFKSRLVISDGSPKSEVQFLCKVQTVNYIEEFYLSHYKRTVLAKNKSNFIWKKDIYKYQLKIDIDFNEMSSNPTLISNFLRHSPPSDIPKLLVNAKNDLSLFGELIDMNKKGIIYN